MWGRRTILRHSCWLTLLVLSLTGTSRCQESPANSNALARDLRRTAQGLGREALWAAAATSALLPGQNAVEAATQNAVQQGTQVLRVWGGAPLADLVTAGNTALGNTVETLRNATQQLAVAAITRAAPWAAPAAEAALSEAATLGRAALAAVPASDFSLIDEDEEAVIRKLAQSPVEIPSFAGKPLGYKASQSASPQDIDGEDLAVGDFFARQEAALAYPEDDFWKTPELAPSTQGARPRRAGPPAMLPGAGRSSISAPGPHMSPKSVPDLPSSTAAAASAHVEASGLVAKAPSFETAGWGSEADVAVPSHAYEEATEAYPPSGDNGKALGGRVATSGEGAMGDEGAPGSSSAPEPGSLDFGGEDSQMDSSSLDQDGQVEEEGMSDADGAPALSPTAEADEAEDMEPDAPESAAAAEQAWQRQLPDDAPAPSPRVTEDEGIRPDSHNGVSPVNAIDTEDGEGLVLKDKSAGPPEADRGKRGSMETDAPVTNAVDSRLRPPDPSYYVAAGEALAKAILGEPEGLAPASEDSQQPFPDASPPAQPSSDSGANGPAPEDALARLSASKAPQAGRSDAHPAGTSQYQPISVLSPQPAAATPDSTTSYLDAAPLIKPTAPQHAPMKTSPQTPTVKGKGPTKGLKIPHMAHSPHEFPHGPARSTAQKHANRVVASGPYPGPRGAARQTGTPEPGPSQQLSAGSQLKHITINKQESVQPALQQDEESVAMSPAHAGLRFSGDDVAMTPAPHADLTIVPAPHASERETVHLEGAVSHQDSFWDGLSRPFRLSDFMDTPASAPDPAAAPGRQPAMAPIVAPLAAHAPEVADAGPLADARPPLDAPSAAPAPEAEAADAGTVGAPVPDVGIGAPSSEAEGPSSDDEAAPAPAYSGLELVDAASPMSQITPAPAPDIDDMSGVARSPAVILGAPALPPMMQANPAPAPDVADMLAPPPAVTLGAPASANAPRAVGPANSRQTAFAQHGLSPEKAPDAAPPVDLAPDSEVLPQDHPDSQDGSVATGQPWFAGQPIAQALAEVESSFNQSTMADMVPFPVLSLRQLRDLPEKTLAKIYQQGIADVPGNITAEKNKFAYCDKNEVLMNSLSRPRGWPTATAIPGYDEMANKVYQLFLVGKVFYTHPTTQVVSLWNLVLSDNNVDNLGTVTVAQDADTDGHPSVLVHHSSGQSLLAGSTQDTFRRVGPSIWLGRSTFALNLTVPQGKLPKPLMTALQSVRNAAEDSAVFQAAARATSKLEQIVHVSYYYAISCQSYYIPKLRYLQPKVHVTSGGSQAQRDNPDTGDANTSSSSASLDAEHATTSHHEPYVLWPIQKDNKKHKEGSFKSMPAALFEKIFNASWAKPMDHGHGL